MTRYTRQDLLRILHLRTGQLLAWERAGLIASFPCDQPAYSFAHLAEARRLRETRAATERRRAAERAAGRSSGRDLRAARWAMEKVEGMMDIGSDVANLQAMAEGTRSAAASRQTGLLRADRTRTRNRGSLLVSQAGRLLRPFAQHQTQQLRFDFELFDRELKVVNAAPLRVVGGRPFALPRAGGVGRTGRGKVLSPAAEVQEMFLRAVRLEETPATVAEAAELYQQILCVKPDHAPAAINLGTIFYNRREFAEAEGMYRRATEADPGYALAFFDLGNVLDEMQRLPDAIAAYTEAITLLPGYADAHYNLALAYERQGERRRALRHWMAYVRLDPIGPWAQHARAQARKILSMERLSIVSRSGRRAVAG